MTTTRPPASSAPSPEKTASQMKIVKWRAHVKETCRGFFSVALPSGMVLKDLVLREKGDSRWINFPSRAYEGEDGQKRYSDYIDFIDDEARNRFRDQVLAALDHHFETMHN